MLWVPLIVALGLALLLARQWLPDLPRGSAPAGPNPVVLAANEKALAALAALPADAPADAVVTALNLMIVDYAGTGHKIPADAEPVLKAAAKAVAALPAGVKLEVRGHMDDSQGRDASFSISLMRAQSVVDFMHDNGVPQGRISAIGAGDMRPIADNKTAEGRFLNRRLVFSIAAG